MLRTSFTACPTLPSLPLTGVGRAFGTCGELAQGQFDLGEDFLVTLPVDVWSEVRVTIDAASNAVQGDGINPCLNSWKSTEADSRRSPQGFDELQVSCGFQPCESQKTNSLPDKAHIGRGHFDFAPPSGTSQCRQARKTRRKTKKSASIRVFRVPFPEMPGREKTKTSLAIRKALDRLGFPNWGATFHVQSGLPEGKGMASSSADIVAACRAVSDALNLPLLAEQISDIAISIEPTDGVMYTGVVCYNHRKGRLLEVLGNMPPVNILILDLGAQVDTVAFNRIQKDYTADERKKIQQAYHLVRDGIRKQDVAQIGLGATLSAEVNQRILPKPHFEKIIHIAREHGASGVCAAHSGTVLGLLFTPRDSHRIAAARQSILNHVDCSINLFQTQTL